ncbi:MAG: PepSY domain-containing protein [Parahaliea sp.]
MKHFTRKLNTALIAGSLGASALAAPTFAANNATEALDALAVDGYVAIYDLELRYGLWTAEATTAAGARVALLLDTDNRVIEVGNTDTADSITHVRGVIEHLRSLGYSRIREVELDQGFWEAEARNLAGFEVELILHPVTLEVLAEVSDGAGAYTSDAGASILTAEQVRDALRLAGYSNIHDLEFDDGYWEAEATNSAGVRVDLKLDAGNGAVIRESLDD